MKKIIAFAGSTSTSSINMQLVNYVLTQLKNVEIEILDLNEFEMPIYSLDREIKDGIPELAERFRNKLHQADGIVCSLAEHNGTYATAFKNILDWCTRIDLNIFNQRPMLLMSTSTGDFGGGNVLSLAKTFFPKTEAKIVSTFSLPKFNNNFNNLKVVDTLLNIKLHKVIDNFQTELELNYHRISA